MTTVTDAAEVVTRLRAVLPEHLLVTDPSRLSSFAHDEAHLCRFGTPAVAVLPRTTEQTQAVLRVASSTGVPVVPQGALSGLAGAANATDGCIALSLREMDRVVDVVAADRYAVVEPGVLTADVARAAAEHGLFYPPDPSSAGWSTIGGNVATNAGGLCCVKYGVTADFVLGLEVVLADGSVVRTGRRTVKGVAGYDLTRLLVGSEGTLGVITQVTLALRPAPGRSRTIAAVFSTTSAAGAAVGAVVAGGCVPSLLEIIDGATLRAVEDLQPSGTPPGAAALLLAQSDSGDRAAEDLDEVARACREHGAVEVLEAEDAEHSARLTQARRLAYPALERLGTVMVDDVAVPRSSLAEFLDGVADVAKRCGLLIGVVGHAGDGNMHPSVVFDRHDPDAARRAGDAFDAVMELGLGLGGTITGEHGVGLLKRDWLAREVGPVGVRLHRGVKDLFDPHGILNPGKVLPDR